MLIVFFDFLNEYKSYIYYIQPTIPYLGDNYLQHNCRDMSHNPHSIYIHTLKTVASSSAFNDVLLREIKGPS